MLCNKQKKLNIFILLMASILLVSSEAGGQSVDDSLVSWWPMEGVVEDIIGDNEPSETVGLTFVEGKVGQGVTLELPPNRYQHGGYIRIPDSPCLRLQRFTIEVWVQPAGPGGGPHDWTGSLIIGKRVSGVEASVGLAWRSLDNRFVYRFGYESLGETIFSLNTFPPLPFGEFYHVAGTYDGQTYKLFVNGQLEGSMVLVKTINYNDSMWQLGAGYFPGWVRTWNGVIDEVRIYNRALTAEEMQPPVAVCQDVTVMADSNCEGVVAPEDVDNGSSDPDGDPITLSLSPEGPYPIGTTAVTLTVTDDQGASSACTATVKVLTASEGILQLVAKVMVLNLHNGIENSLDAKLENALKALDDLNANNDVSAINAIDAFINAVEAQSGDKIATEDADDLIDTANKIIVGLQNGCY